MFLRITLKVFLLRGFSKKILLFCSEPAKSNKIQLPRVQVRGLATESPSAKKGEWSLLTWRQREGKRSWQSLEAFGESAVLLSTEQLEIVCGDSLLS